MAKAKKTDTGMAEDGKKQALDLAIAQISKQFGDGSIMKLGENHKVDVELLPSGCLSLDIALGGGYPKGRIIEIYGPESSGKTTLTLHAIAEIQKQGGTAAFIDAEHALDPIYAKKLGVDIERLIVSQPDNGEEALEITEKLIRSSAVDLVVVDSVAALVPKAEIEGNMGDSHMALQARLMSQALRKIAGQMNKTNTTVIFINQIREKVGVLYGSPEVTPGGRALKFYSSVRIDIRKADKILESGVMVGNKTKVKIVKNKVAAPFKEVMLTMRYGKGLDTEGDIINLAIDFGVVEKAGSWFSYNGERIGQGRDKVREYMEANPDKKEEIEEKVKQMARENTSYGMMEDDDDDSVDTDTTEE